MNTIIYILACCVAAVMAFLLARFAGLSFQIKIKAKNSDTASAAADTQPLKKAVFKELGTVIDSESKREAVAKALEGLVAKELEKRVEVSSKNLSKRYETIIEKKTRDEEFAWTKYKKVLAEKKGTDAVIRSIAQGLVVVDAKGKVIMMNPAAEKLLGTTKKEKIGKAIDENIAEGELISLTKGDDEAAKEIELISQEDETTKTLRSSSAVIENENGQTVGMVSMISDVTKQKEVERMKSDFVANVTHELRTPLITIDKSISLLRSQATGPVSETQEQFLSIAERNIKRLGSLINDLLDLSKLEAGKMKIELMPTQIEPLINESVETFNAWAATKGITIEKNVQENLPMLAIDPHRINQVLNNLIGNAIKFTPQGGTIALAAGIDTDNNGVRVSVQDTGVGISEEDLKSIFDKFYQAGERAPTDISGTGLGLAITKEIVEIHGGKIWAESENHQGAKFIFTLPRHEQKENGG